MKIFVLASVMLISVRGLTQSSIPADSAASHIGDSLKVCGKVYGTRFLESAKGGPTFINMGAEYPNSPFTVVIFAEDRKKFKVAPEKLFDGKQLCVMGRIIEYKGKAEIIVKEPTQIDVTE